jgi:lipid-binding SYLF domain-containing protein
MPTQRLSQRINILVLLAGVLLSTVGCSFTTNAPSTPQESSQTRAAIDSQVSATLTKLYSNVNGSRALVQQAKGVLVFPSEVKAGFIVGGEHGRGALRVGGQTVGYYSTTGISFGWQAGAQSRAIVLLFMTQQALDRFRASQGWKVGADATVAIAKVGANGSIDTNTTRQPVIGFIMNNAGLMAGVTLEGSKITKINP